MADVENITEYRRGLRERILDTAIREFAERGIKGVKMDNIANSLSISKRTLYELYSNKEVLLLESLKRSVAEKNEELKKAVEGSSNVMDVIIRAFHLRIEEVKGVNPMFFNDLIKYPLIVRYFKESREAKHEVMLRFLERGVNEGYFKPEYNYELVLNAFEGAEKRIMLNNLMQDYTIEEIIFNMLFVILRGICTPKGIDILDRLIEQSRV